MENIINSLDDQSLKSLIIFNSVKSNPTLKSLAEDIHSNLPNSLKNHIFQRINKIQLEIETEMQNLLSNLSSIQSINNSLSKSQTTKPIRIYMDGVFDIIHSGHFNAIRQSKKLGNILVVGVNSDEDVEKSKGPTLMNCKERATLARACKWVDEVIEDTPYTPTIDLLDNLNIDYCAHGDDMPVNSNGVGCYDEIKNAGRLRIFKRTEGISTTEIIGRLLMCTKENDRVKAEFDHMPITSSELIKDFAKNEVDEFNRRPVVSTFLTTGWRMIEFCNNRVPNSDDKVVYLDGAFDILHIGHIEMLRKARESGDFLYVGVHDDFTVNNYLGKNSPILNLQERIFNLLALKYVDDVVIGAPYKITEDLIRSLNINSVIGVNALNKEIKKKKISNNEENQDRFEIPKKLGIYYELNFEFDLNNEILVQRILIKREQYVKKYKNRSEKEENYYTKEKEYVQEI